MVLIGIDFGSDSCVVTTVIGRRLEALINDHKDRRTPSIVAFGERKREIGAAAKKFLTTNIKNTVHGFKQYLMEPQHNNNDASYSVSYATLFSVIHLQEGRTFNAIQVTSMLLAKIKADANSSLQPNEVSGCVLSVPSYFNEKGRKALLLAAALAGLDCHFLIKETTAVSINYFFYKKFTTPINVIFIDFGHSSIQIFACKFSEKQIQITAEVAKLIGGRDIDKSLADHIVDDLNIPGVNKHSKDFYAQLLHEVEELKIKFTSNSDTMQFNLKDLIDEKQISISMGRADMEYICKHLFDDIEELMRQCLIESELSVEEIHCIEMVGGSSRIPMVQELVHKVFGKLPIATMNREEAVSRGCFLKSRIAKVMKDVIIVEKTTLLQDDMDIDGLINVEQVHPNFRGNGKSCLMIDEKSFQHFLSIESDLKDNDNKEIDRQNIRNQLEEFINQEHHFLETFVTTEEMRELESIKYWHNGLFYQYSTCLGKWTQRVENEKEQIRLNKFQDLWNFVCTHNKPNGLLSFMPELSQIELWIGGRTEEYIAKLEQLTVCVEKEKERRHRKKELIDFVEAELQPGGNLCNYAKNFELKYIKNWNDGTIEEYIEKYNFLRNYTELEKERKNVRKKLIEIMEAETAPGGTLTDYKYKNDLKEVKKWKNGTITQYNEKYDAIVKTINSTREAIRTKHREKLFKLIETERKQGGIHYITFEDNNLIDKNALNMWLSVEEQLNESSEYYLSKYKEFTIYSRNEKHRRAEYQKLFDLVHKEIEERGTLQQADENVRKSWTSILGVGNETVEYYNSKHKELSSYIKREKCRWSERKKLFDLINKEKEPGCYLYHVEENVRMAWLSILELVNESIEYYINKHIDLSACVTNETLRQNERRKLFDLIHEEGKRDGTLNQVDDKLISIWMSILDQHNESIEFYNEKLNELEVHIENEKVRRTERKKYFDLIYSEGKSGGIFYPVNENAKNEWMASLELINETTEYYEKKAKEFASYKIKESIRRTERQKLFDLIDKKEGFLVDLDMNSMKNWKYIRGCPDETYEFYNIKYTELSTCMEEERDRMKACQKLISYIQTIEDTYGKFDTEGRYLAKLDEIRKQPHNTTEEYLHQLENVEKESKTWKLPLLSTSIRSEFDYRIVGLLKDVAKYKELVDILKQIQSNLSVEVLLGNTRIELDAAEIRQYIDNILKSVKAFARSYFSLFFTSSDIRKIHDMNQKLQEKISNMLDSNNFN